MIPFLIKGAKLAWGAGKFLVGAATTTVVNKKVGDALEKKKKCPNCGCECGFASSELLIYILVGLGASLLGAVIDHYVLL